MKYSIEDEALLREMYDGTPESVLVIAKTLSRSVPSVRSKLAILKDENGNRIYVSPNAKPKYASGMIEKPTAKTELVADIEQELFRVTGEKLSLGSLTKAGKMDLVNIYNALSLADTKLKAADLPVASQQD